MKQAELFARPAEPHPYAELSERLWSLARQGVYFGTSSWKYDSWRDTVYVRNYTSKKNFENHCLEEYAKIFPAVGGDFSFYHWPTPEMITRINEQTPEGFKIGLKATEYITLRKYPNIARWGTKAGRDNNDFLNAGLFKTEFLDRLAPIRSKLAPIILEFTAFPAGSFNDWTEFAAMLEKFFTDIAKLCGDHFNFGVELRTKDYLHADYYAALKAMNEHVRVSPILSSWTRMPPLDEQWKIFTDHDFPFIECRPVMRPGRTRAEAVELFEPYDRKRETNVPARRALKTIVQWALDHGKPCYLFVNNHLEGCAHQTIAELIDELPFI